MTVSYMAPCSETPVIFLAFLMAVLMALSGYWVILKWVAKVRCQSSLLVKCKVKMYL